MRSATRRSGIASLLVGLGFLAASAAHAAGPIVTSTADSGAGTLRAAITSANAGGVAVGIVFDITGGCATPCTIQLSGPLPVITVPVTIDGYSQPGASPNTLAVGDDAVVKIVLDINGVTGTQVMTFSPAAAGSIIKGLAIVNSVSGPLSQPIYIQASNVAIEGNFIGVNAAGTAGAAGVDMEAITLVSGDNLRIGGTAPAQRNVIGGADVGITILAGTGHVVQGNYIGTNAAGTASIGNGYGVFVLTSSAAVGTVTIGGTSAGSGNVISGNTGSGIRVFANVNPTGALTIQGNLIGMNAAGSAAIGNLGDGITLLGNVGNPVGPVTVGGSSVAAANVISGNTGNGIYGNNLSTLTVLGNSIGSNAAGTAGFGNGHWGVNVEGDSFAGSAQIGGSGLLDRNVVGGNVQGGLRFIVTTATVQGNLIGVGADLTTHLANGIGVLVDSGDALVGGTTGGQGNTIAFNVSHGVQVGISNPGIHNAARATINGNAIYNNGGFGIYFLGTGAGPLPNDPLDADTGPNGRQNHPVLTSATIFAGQAVVSGVLDSAPNTLYRIEWFGNVSCDSVHNGEGRRFLSGGNYMTDSSGHVAFSGVMMPIPVGYSIITATATDPAGNTSEFSPCVTAVGPATSFYTVTPCRLSDTRNPNGTYGGPALHPLETRGYPMYGQCGVPFNAVAVALNVAVTAPSDPGNLICFPAGADLPPISTINYGIGRTRSNNTIVPLGPGGEMSVYANQANGTVQVIIDVTGYFQ
jgi:hypothetical protein